MCALCGKFCSKTVRPFNSYDARKAEVLGNTQVEKLMFWIKSPLFKDFICNHFFPNTVIIDVLGFLYRVFFTQPKISHHYHDAKPRFAKKLFSKKKKVLLTKHIFYGPMKSVRDYFSIKMLNILLEGSPMRINGSTRIFWRVVVLCW